MWRLLRSWTVVGALTRKGVAAATAAPFLTSCVEGSCITLVTITVTVQRLLGFP